MPHKEKAEPQLHGEASAPLDAPWESEKRQFLKPFILLAKHKIFILAVLGGAFVVSAVIALVLPQYYSAKIGRTHV